MPYYRTIITVEVLSDRPYDNGDLEQLAYDVTDGDCSGDVTVGESEEVSAERMAELLIAQGSGPGFLLGSDWEEEGESEGE